MTTTNSWLPLAEYSMKHQVSISTLRRRIKSDELKFRFDDGKYLILDEGNSKVVVAEEHRPSLKSEVQKTSAQTTQEVSQVTQATQDKEAMPGLQTNFSLQTQDTNESVISAANRLLLDLKKAYTQVLQEKEEQILVLREETMDLKTLIKVLESENSRLRN